MPLTAFLLAYIHQQCGTAAVAARYNNKECI